MFGSRVHFMHKNRQKKLDRMDNVGTFMTYKGNNSLAYVIDNATGQERVTTHLNFDEAYVSAPAGEQPPMGTALQQSGFKPEKEDTCHVKVKLVSKHAKCPVRGSEEAAALDVYAAKSLIVQPHDQTTIPTGIALEIPKGYHAELKVRSSFAIKYKARVEAGLIDSDYRCQVFVILSNNGDAPIKISQGDRIAQMVLVRDPSVTIDIAHDLTSTKQNQGKFGSTGIQHIVHSTLYDQSTAAAAKATSTETVMASHQLVELS